MVGRLKYLFLILCVPLFGGTDYFSSVIDKAGARAALMRAGIPESKLPGLAGTHYILLGKGGAEQLLWDARTKVSREIPKWSENYNCFSICWGVVDEANRLMARERHHFPSAGRAVRAGVIAVSYKPEGKPEHTILLFLEVGGAKWADPQNGKFFQPSPQELQTVYFPQA